MTHGLIVKKSFLIKSDNINFSIYNMPESVMVNESGDCWINQSQIITVSVYGEHGNYPMNASIGIFGCGLNITINEKCAVEEGYWIEDGVYNISISPKQAGTITIMVINLTYNLSNSKDFIIMGLFGFAQTSYLEDKVIIIGRTEKIIFQIRYGQYAEVHLTWVNELWTDSKCINQTMGDNTAGNGLNGIFEFDVTKDDIDDCIGYIIIVGSAGGHYVWDLIEIQEPIYIPPPNINGTTIVKSNFNYNFSFVTTIPDKREVSYYIEWGDGQITNWTSLLESGNPYVENHSWMNKGLYLIKAIARDAFGTQSQTSEHLIIVIKSRTDNNFWIMRFLEWFPLLERLFQILFHEYF